MTYTPADPAVSTLRDANPVALLQQLLRFDTSNPPGNEARCISFIEELLRGAGLQTRLIESAPGRPNLIARLEGRGVSPALLLHGHVDVVPAPEPNWQHPPFAGDIVDGFVWGRGALDMKGGVAMLLAAVLMAAGDTVKPPGDVLVAMVVDEECGSDHGAAFLVDRHRELLKGVRYGIGEFGGFSLPAGRNRRVYPVQVAEKQLCWMRATIRGEGGHGALGQADGAITGLLRALRGVQRGRLPVRMTPLVRIMFNQLACELPWARRMLTRGMLQAHAEALMSRLGAIPETFEPMLRNTVSVTGICAGGQGNVIPGSVTLDLDCRMVPGCEVQGADLRAVCAHGTRCRVRAHTLRSRPGPRRSGPISDS